MENHIFLSYVNEIHILENNFFDRFPPILLFIIPGYLFFSVIVSIFMHKKLKKYFAHQNPNLKKVFNIGENIGVALSENTDTNFKGNKQEILIIEAESVDVNSNFDDLYPEFARYDWNRIYFIRVLFGTTFLVIIRFLVLFVMLLILVICLTIINCFITKNRRAPKTGKCTRFIIRTLIYLTIFPMQIIMGIYAFKSRRDDAKVKEVYEKYFGPDYDITDKNKKFSMYISNHHGWIEAVNWIIKLTPGYIAKQEFSSVPLLGALLQNLDCLFVNRKDQENRNKIAEQMKLRQEIFYNGETSSPLLIYPEGTVSNGSYILEFKKGAFMAKLPLKPLCAVSDEDYQGIYMTPMTLFDHMYYIFCYCWTYVKMHELPVIECTDYMLQNHRLEGESDDETYCRVANLLYQEIYGLKFSKKTYKDLDEYEHLCEIRGY